MLVPGVLNHELPENHYRSREIFTSIFEQNHLYRLADGGLTSNVPVRAAEAEINAGRIGHDNTFILGLDVFAPQKTDGLFYPLQQIANINVLEDAKHADSVVRLKYLLSPMNLFPSLSELRWLTSHFRTTFAQEMHIIHSATAKLPSLKQLELI